MYIWIIIQKLISLYVNILLGFLCSRVLKMTATDIAKLIFYVITPFVTLQGVLKTDLNGPILLLPFILLIICSILCLVFYQFSKRFWLNEIRNIVALSAGTGNTGFLGIPIAIAITNNDNFLVGTYITAMIGVSLYENSLGFFIASKGQNDAKDSLKKLLKLPVLYSFIIGTTLNLLGVRFNELPLIITDFLNYMQGCYFVIGIIIIGIALGQVEKFEIDFKFLGVTFFAKFIVWPIVMFLFIILDKLIFNLYSDPIYQMLMLLSIVPLATNIVTISTLLKVYPEKAATTFLISAIFAIFYMSVMINYVIK